MKRKPSLRRIVFQVHLWVGLGLGVYAFLIGLTGSVLVFHKEIVAWTAPPPTVSAATAQAPIEVIRAGIESHYPGWHIWGLETPSAAGEAWRSYIQQGSTFRTVFADPQGRVVGEVKPGITWLRLAERFHSVLLIPGGRLPNGIAGLGLVVLAACGVVLWWPARGRWNTAFRIVRRSSWKGILYDLHRVGGIVAFGFIVLFGITGGYFTWPAAYRNITSLILPTTPKLPEGRVAMDGGRRPVDELVANAQRAVPETTLVRVLTPRERGQPVTIVLAHGPTPADRLTRTSQLTMNPHTGEMLTVDDFRKRPAGDRLLNWMGPLHGGHFGGFWVRVLWALAGLMLPALFVTGFVMWCNRVVAPRLRQYDDRRRADSGVSGNR
jgi:uncharacterized iron-regulated membrane protein